MTERKTGQGRKPEPIETEVNASFQPFKQIELKRTSLDEAELQEVARVPFFCRGITPMGFFTLTSHPRPEDILKLATPLGSVRLVKEVEGKRIQVVETPLLLGVDFLIRDINELTELSNYRITIMLGGRSYAASPKGSRQHLREEAEADIKQNEKATIHYEVCDQNERKDDTTTFLLPFDVRRLSQIRATIMEKNWEG